MLYGINNFLTIYPANVAIMGVFVTLSKLSNTLYLDKYRKSRGSVYLHVTKTKLNSINWHWYEQQIFS